MATLNNIIKLDEMSLNTQIASASDISTFVNTTASDTLGGAKTYTDAEISALSADFNARIAALEGFTSFIGVKDSLPETAEDGQICIVGNKEYIYGSKADGSVGWTELGDTTAEAAAIDELSSAIEAVEASLSGYDTVGSAAAAQEAAISAAKAYTDEQITAVEGEISSLTDVVETKADQTAVDAAISAINDSISTLSAKAEEDPVFTAWKDSESVALGKGAIAPNDSIVAVETIAIGKDATTNNDGAVAIGRNSISEGNDSVAIGGKSFAGDDSAVAIGINDSYAGARGQNAIAIGKSAYTAAKNGIAIGASAKANALNTVQLGEGSNFEENSLQFRSTQIVDGNGKITTANLAGIDTLKTAVSAIEEVTAEDNVQVLREAVNTLVAAIKTFVGA